MLKLLSAITELTLDNVVPMKCLARYARDTPFSRAIRARARTTERGRARTVSAKRRERHPTTTNPPEPRTLPPRGRYDFFDHLLVMTIAPLALICACAAASLALARRAAALTFGAGARRAAAERRAALTRASEACFKAALLVCFVTLPAVSTTIFRTLHCDKLEHGEEFLHADLSIDCTSARHRKFKVRKRRRPEALRLPSRRLTPALYGTHTCA